MKTFQDLNQEHGTLRDKFDQEFKIGSKVVWVGGKGNYAGVQLSTVIGRSKMKLYVEMPKTGGCSGTTTKLIDPSDLVIVDKLC